MEVKLGNKMSHWPKFPHRYDYPLILIKHSVLHILEFYTHWIFVHTSGVSGGLASLSLEHLASMLATNESVTIKYRSQCCDWSIALMCARMKTKCSWLLHHRLEHCEVRQTKDFPTPWFRNFCLQKANNTSDCLSPIKDQRSLAQYTTMNWNIIRVD